MDHLEIIKQCTINDNIVSLPDIQLDRKLYLSISKSLELIGGKWNRKAKGFIFKSNPTELINRIINCEKVNLKKELQFFETSENLCDDIVNYAELKETDEILEPSAGQGAIIKSIHKKFPDKTIDCYELMDINHVFLNKLNTNILGKDFLECEKIYDKILANPPFSKNQDIIHIKKMYSLLKDNGILVSVSSKHWTFCNNKQETEFRNWLNTVNHEIIEIPEETFKNSGTNISTLLIIIRK